VHITRWSNGEKKKERKLHSSKDNSMKDLVDNEENGYPVPDSNKTIINITKEPSDTYKEIPQRGNHGRDH
jgi:hypothetical protein